MLKIKHELSRIEHELFKNLSKLVESFQGVIEKHLSHIFPAVANDDALAVHGLAALQVVGLG